MILTFRPIRVWPEGWDRTKPPQKSSPFSAGYRSTLEKLGSELWELQAKNPILQVDAPEARIRMDGQLHADAKVDYPGVILSFDTPKHGTLTYACNRFAAGSVWSSASGRRVGRPGWHENLRAIALGLEALRKVERYGIGSRGQQYAGYAELPSGIALGGAMTVEGAVEILRTESKWAGEFDPLADREQIDVAYRAAAKRTHPDAGGDPEVFRNLTEARDLLEKHIR